MHRNIKNQPKTLNEKILIGKSKLVLDLETILASLSCFLSK